MNTIMLQGYWVKLGATRWAPFQFLVVLILSGFFNGNVLAEDAWHRIIYSARAGSLEGEPVPPAKTFFEIDAACQHATQRFLADNNKTESYFPYPACEIKEVRTAVPTGNNYPYDFGQMHQKWLYCGVFFTFTRSYSGACSYPEEKREYEVNPGNGITWVIECDPGYVFGSQGPWDRTGCKWLTTKHAPKKQCEAQFGHPIVPSAGAKSLVLNFGVFNLKATYDTRGMLRSSTQDSSWTALKGGAVILPQYTSPPVSFGKLWQSNHHKFLMKANSESVILVDGVHSWKSFKRSMAYPYNYYSGDGKDVLIPDALNWFLLRGNGEVAQFAPDGSLTKWHSSVGAYSYEYSNAQTDPTIAPKSGLLTTIIDQSGRKLSFSYKTLRWGEVGIATVKLNDQIVAEIGYTDVGFMMEVKWADGSKRTYLYEDLDKPWAVTGQLDESLSRLASYSYDEFGRADSTSLSGNVNKYIAEWDSIPERNFIDEEFERYIVRTFFEPAVRFRVRSPLGGLIESETQRFGDSALTTYQSQPSGSGCDVSSMQREYDLRGSVVSNIDYSGRRTCFAHDATRNLEEIRLEGLVAADGCPTDWATHKVPTDLPSEKAQRKVHTQWHPVWHLKTREAEPKRITTWVYNGQPDPLNNNAVASCAPADALLPDGSKIAVLCKRYEQATADETGNLGFAAAALSTRSWSTTYNQHGQVLSETDPRQKKTCHQYWSDTVFDTDGRGHTLGDLWRTSQMAGASQDCTPENMAAQAHKTTHTHYNKRGQVLRTELPNGGVEEREYHLRGWLTKVKQWASVAAADSGAPSQDTQYDYYPTGLLKQVTQADGSWQLYEYDDAHRLTDVSDSLGNKVHYTLDNAGNATQEAHTDPTGVLVKAISRTFDALGRLQSQKLGAP